MVEEPLGRDRGLLQHAGEVRAEESMQDKNRQHDRQRPAERPAAGFDDENQHENAHGPVQRLERGDVGITILQPVMLEVDVGGRQDCQKRQPEVEPGNAAILAT